MLGLELQSLFKNFRFWKVAYLMLHKRKWKVELIYDEEVCYFGNGWHNFAKKCNIEAGDTISMFRTHASGAKTVNVVIFKQKHELICPSRGKKTLKIYLIHFVILYENYILHAKLHE